VPRHTAGHEARAVSPKGADESGGRAGRASGLILIHVIEMK